MTTSRTLTTAIAAVALIGVVGFAYAQSRTAEQMNKDTDNATTNTAPARDGSVKPAAPMAPNRMAPAAGMNSNGQPTMDTNAASNPNPANTSSPGMPEQRMARADRN